MNKDLNALTPHELWKNFHALTTIPRPSKKEARIIEFIKEFGLKNGLETMVDEIGNVIIRKPATPGMENRKGVILQSHLDMVPQKNSDKVHDFENDPIEAYIDGDWVKANGTTLGADNGMGVAATLAVLESKNLVHGPVEGLFTIDEETGMAGAMNLKPGVLKGDILLNMDSEDEGELYVGCAGGLDASSAFIYSEEPVKTGLTAFRIAVTGLKGGHSGIDINLYKGNANKIMNRLLFQATETFHIRLATLEGGSLRNAIPREAFAVIVIEEKKSAEFLKMVSEFEKIVKNEYSTIDPDLKITATTSEIPARVMPADTQLKFLRAIYSCPNGVIRMSSDMPGLTETSTNLAIVKAGNGKAEVHSLLRSSVDSAKDDLAAMVKSVFDLAGADTKLSGAYPGWKPNPSSAILKTMISVYENMYGKTPEIKAIHAGLECGILGGVYPNWDMISFGPTIRFPHSPDEKVNIPTVQKFWDYLVETLKNIPVK